MHDPIGHGVLLRTEQVQVRDDIAQCPVDVESVVDHVGDSELRAVGCFIGAA